MQKRIGVLLIVLFLSGCVSKLKTIKNDKDVHLEQGQGYLLMAINTNVSLTKLYVSGTQRFTLSKEDLKRGTNYILVNLPAGEYEFNKAHFYNYYFSISDSDHDWQFKIKPNIISYIGDLNIETEWWGRRSYMELVNNSSIALEFLETKFPNILKSRQVEYQGPGNDDFFQVVAQSGESK